LDQAVDCVRHLGAPVALYQCTTAYPCPPEKLGLNVLTELRDRYGCPVGLSDHSGTIYPSLAAVTLSANMIEVHVVLSRECFGPDLPASVTTAELRQLVEGVRFLERALACPVNKEDLANELADLRRLFGKSVVAARDLPVGHRLTLADLAFKKPGTGLPAARYKELVNLTLRRAVAADTPFTEGDVV
jgi:N-acetylneuraminate synthase